MNAFLLGGTIDTERIVTSSRREVTILKRAQVYSAPRLYASLVLAAAVALVVMPGGGHAQIEQPVEGVGVFAALAVGPGAGQVVQLPNPQPAIQGQPIDCRKEIGKKTLPVGVCTAQFALNQPGADVIGLSATPAAGSTFVGWVVYPETTQTHRCGVEPVCYVLMGHGHAAVAVFDVPPRPPAAPVLVPVTVTRQGAAAELGSVTSNPTGITCIPGDASSCAAGYPIGTTVTLTATPGPASTLDGWGGACAGAATSSTCTLTLGVSTAAVSASFGIATQQLSVAIQGPANSGGVASDVQPGISCPTTCGAAFAQASQVALTATPAPGFAFSGWSGSGCSGTSACTVVIGAQAGTVTASFRALAVDAALQRVTVVKTGPNYATRQVQAALRANEVVSVVLRVRRGKRTLAQRTQRSFGPGIAISVVNLRRSVSPGRAQVQATFTNSVGTRKVQTRNITIPR